MAFNVTKGTMMENIVFHFCFTSFAPKKEQSLYLLSYNHCHNSTKLVSLLFESTRVIVKTVLKRRYFLHCAFSELNLTKKV